MLCCIGVGRVNGRKSETLKMSGVGVNYEMCEGMYVAYRLQNFKGKMVRYIYLLRSAFCLS